MERRNLKHKKADELYEDILYLITRRFSVVITAFKHLVTRAPLVLLPYSQEASLTQALLLFTF